MKNKYYAVIMAGGVGSRFWPVSTQQNPKQFHDMLGTGQTLIQKTFDRLNKIIPSENIKIATNERYEGIVLKQLPKIDKKQVLLEPAMRNTAPCILYSALKIYKENPEAVMIVAPSDHWIEKEATFLENLEMAFEVSSQNDVLLTLGIEPNHPNTGYGYIQFEKSEQKMKKVRCFTEKPSLEKAEKFIKQGDYLWNAGIFVWSAKSILQAFQRHLPKMYDLFSKGLETLNTEKESGFINEYYADCENISIDFGIMEKAENVSVIPVDIGWNDLGTWGSLYQKKQKDEKENATIGGTVFYRESNKNIVRVSEHKKVVLQGVTDFIIVEKDDVLFICSKSKEQEIKQIREEVRNVFGEEIV